MVRPDPATRLVTLTGPGGIGKSRTALYLAAILLDDFPDGVWLVTLEEARNRDGIVARIVHSLGMQPQGDRAVEEQLWDFLRDRSALLLLDNTEHLPEASDVIRQLLLQAPHTKCLVTGRVSLNLGIERVVEVDPLPPAEACALFLQCAQAKKADFQFSRENRADVQTLCRRLDGIPLAIELAASRIVALTPREILGRLDKQLDILVTRRPDLPPRQRALRATIAWSYDLLGEEDRSLFSQLSVFAGFMLPDAEAVCEGVDVFEGVFELRRQSLLREVMEPLTQTTRYQMLDSIRDYSRERLRESAGRESELQRKHAEHFLGFAEAQFRHDRKAGERDAIAAMEREFENLVAATSWAWSTAMNPNSPERGKMAELSGRLALALGWLLERRGFWLSALDFVRKGQEALAAAGPERQGCSSLLRTSLRAREAGLLLDTGELSGAAELARAALTEYQGLEHLRGQADCLNLLAILHGRNGKGEKARACLQEALQLRESAGDLAGVVICLVNLGPVYQEAGDLAAARASYQRALDLARGAGDRRGEAEVLNNLGLLGDFETDLSEAERFYRAALEVEHEQRNRFGMARALHNLGETAEKNGNRESAVTCFAAAHHLFSTLGSPYAGYSLDFLRKNGGDPVAELDTEEVVESVLSQQQKCC